MWLPNALVKNIPPGVNDPKITPVGVVLHVRAGKGDSLFNVFQSRGGIESHFYVRYTGVIEQYRDTDYEADAQSAGNSWVSDGIRYGLISVETEGVCGEEWTPQQIASIKSIITAMHQRYNIPLRVCPNYHSGGIGYHALFDQWNPNNHACPCKERIAQFSHVLVPFLSTLAHPPIVQTTQKVQESPDMMGYQTTDGFYVPGGDRDANGRVKLYRLAGGDAEDGHGNFRDYRNAGVNFAEIDVPTLNARGFAVQYHDFK